MLAGRRRPRRLRKFVLESKAWLGSLTGRSAQLLTSGPGKRPEPESDVAAEWTGSQHRSFTRNSSISNHQEKKPASTPAAAKAAGPTVHRSSLMKPTPCNTANPDFPTFLLPATIGHFSCPCRTRACRRVPSVRRSCRWTSPHTRYGEAFFSSRKKMQATLLLGPSRCPFSLRTCS